jgi:hypothetical protein
MPDESNIPKSQKTEKGEFYFAGRCPITGKLLIIEHDPSRGAKPYHAGYASISCHHCQNSHRFTDRDIFRILATGDE